MRTARGLHARCYEWGNLELALCKALRGKRLKQDAQHYVAHAEKNLTALAAQLRSTRLDVGLSHQFTIYDPKERVITAPCFAERVQHHAVMNVCEAEFEQRLIPHTYACRRGKGQFAAIAKAAQLARGHSWFMKMDVRKYFDSIPKKTLLARLDRVFQEPSMQRVFSQLIHTHSPGLERGLPIGSLISQHCANLYLDAVDRAVTEDARIGSYVRYMDDFVVWHDDKALLKELRRLLGEVLAKLGLSFKYEPYINRSHHGADFLGHRVTSEGVKLNRRSRLRFIQRMGEIMEDADGGANEQEIQQRAAALTAFVQHYSGAAWRLRAIQKAGAAPQAPTA
jgi:RNA-directed DNA polymerase